MQLAKRNLTQEGDKACLTQIEKSKAFPPSNHTKYCDSHCLSVTFILHLYRNLGDGTSAMRCR